jgi:hypothetical protein
MGMERWWNGDKQRKIKELIPKPAPVSLEVTWD